jgi:hypothetical protein
MGDPAQNGPSSSRSPEEIQRNQKLYCRVASQLPSESQGRYSADQSLRLAHLREESRYDGLGASVG